MPARSLIIPTHERSRYAVGTVETILVMGDNIERTVSDTRAKNGWDAIVPPKLKMVCPTPEVSVVSNFDIALSHVLTAGAAAKAGRALERVWRWLTVRFAITEDERIGCADTIATAAEIFNGIAAGPNPDLSRA